MKPKTIENNATFRLNDLTSQKAENACPVIGCRETTNVIGKHPVCPLHGLEIHKATFVYYNGASRAARTQACLRNLLMNVNYYSRLTTIIIPGSVKHHYWSPKS